jgi:hypothetical protein
VGTRRVGGSALLSVFAPAAPVLGPTERSAPGDNRDEIILKLPDRLEPKAVGLHRRRKTRAPAVRVAGTEFTALNFELGRQTTGVEPAWIGAAAQPAFPF